MSDDESNSPDRPLQSSGELIPKEDLKSSAHRDSMRDGDRDSPHAEREFIAQLALKVTSHSGPIPHPEIMEAYERAIPGSGNKILKMAKDTSTHRQGMDRRQMMLARRALELKGRESLLGQVFAFTLALVAILGGIAMLGFGRSTEGYVAIITAAAALVSAFAIGRFTQKTQPDGDDGKDKPKLKGSDDGGDPKGMIKPRKEN